MDRRHAYISNDGSVKRIPVIRHESVRPFNRPFIKRKSSNLQIDGTLFAEFCGALPGICFQKLSCLRTDLLRLQIPLLPQCPWKQVLQQPLLPILMMN